MLSRVSFRAAVFLGALLAALGLVSARGEGIGDPAPPVAVGHWLKNGPVDLPSGKSNNIYVIEFWATWCIPCGESIPRLTALQNKYRDKGVIIIGITDESLSDARPFVHAMGDKMDYAVALDAAGTTSANYLGRFKAEGIPHAFVIDRNGVVAWRGHTMKGLEDALARVVSQRPAAAPKATPAALARTVPTPAPTPASTPLPAASPAPTKAVSPAPTRGEISLPTPIPSPSPVHSPSAVASAPPQRDATLAIPTPIGQAPADATATPPSQEREDDGDERAETNFARQDFSDEDFEDYEEYEGEGFLGSFIATRGWSYILFFIFVGLPIIWVLESTALYVAVNYMITTDKKATPVQCMKAVLFLKIAQMVILALAVTAYIAISFISPMLAFYVSFLGGFLLWSLASIGIVDNIEAITQPRLVLFFYFITSIFSGLAYDKIADAIQDRPEREKPSVFGPSFRSRDPDFGSGVDDSHGAPSNVEYVEPTPAPTPEPTGPPSPEELKLADGLIAKAGEAWGGGDKFGALAHAENALKIYKRLPDKSDPRIARTEAMVQEALKQIGGGAP